MKFLNKRLIAFLLAFITCFSIFALVTPVIAQAAVTEYEDEDDWISDYDTFINRSPDDFFLEIYIKCPEKLKSTVRVLLENQSTGQRYFARVEYINDHYANIYLPAGKYTVVDIYCPDTKVYDFIIDPSVIIATTRGSGKVTFEMVDWYKWSPDEYGNLQYDENATMPDENGNGNENQGGNNNTGNENQNNNQNNQSGNQTQPDKELTQEEFIAEMTKGLYDTPFDFIKMDEKNNLYYVTNYTGSSKAYMSVTGFSKQACDGYVQIVKSGILGEATFKISVDGGQTFLPQTYVASSSTEISSLGLKIGFATPKDTDELVIGDVYTFKTITTYSVKTNVRPNYGMVLAIGNASKSASYKVEIMSSGGLGVSKVAIYDAKLEEVTPEDKTIMVIPEDGIIHLDDNIQLVFKDMDTYIKGQLFEVSADIPTEEVLDYTKLYILCGIVAFIGIGAFVILNNKKEKKADYNINEYNGYQDEDTYK